MTSCACVYTRKVLIAISLSVRVIDESSGHTGGGCATMSGKVAAVKFFFPYNGDLKV